MVLYCFLHPETHFGILHLCKGNAQAVVKKQGAVLSNAPVSIFDPFFGTRLSVEIIFGNEAAHQLIHVGQYIAPEKTDPFICVNGKYLMVFGMPATDLEGDLFIDLSIAPYQFQLTRLMQGIDNIPVVRFGRCGNRLFIFALLHIIHGMGERGYQNIVLLHHGPSGMIEMQMRQQHLADIMGVYSVFAQLFVQLQCAFGGCVSQSGIAQHIGP